MAKLLSFVFDSDLPLLFSVDGSSLLVAVELSPTTAALLEDAVAAAAALRPFSFAKRPPTVTVIVAVLVTEPEDAADTAVEESPKVLFLGFCSTWRLVVVGTSWLSDEAGS